jgi:hypothetical protein
MAQLTDLFKLVNLLPVRSSHKISFELLPGLDGDRIVAEKNTRRAKVCLQFVGLSNARFFSSSAVNDT